jgi:hypothetical protein
MLLAQSATITVSATTPAITLSATAVARGGIVTATWSGIVTTTARDWLALYNAGATNGAYQTWTYISCSQTPTTPQASGSCPFTIPASSSLGNYELRLLANDGFIRLATSNAITVKTLPVITIAATDPTAAEEGLAAGDLNQRAAKRRDHLQLLARPFGQVQIHGHETDVLRQKRFQFFYRLAVHSWLNATNDSARGLCGRGARQIQCRHRGGQQTCTAQESAPVETVRTRLRWTLSHLFLQNCYSNPLTSG